MRECPRPGVEYEVQLSPVRECPQLELAREKVGSEMQVRLHGPGRGRPRVPQWLDRGARAVPGCRPRLVARGWAEAAWQPVG